MTAAPAPLRVVAVGDSVSEVVPPGRPVETVAADPIAARLPAHARHLMWLSRHLLAAPRTLLVRRIASKAVGVRP